jgi:hypothetical protein
MTTKSNKVEVPYITESGNPIHMVSKPEQDSYMLGLDDNQKREVLTHANALAQAIHRATVSRTEMRRKSRDLMRMPANSSPEDKSKRMSELEQLKSDYDALEEKIAKAKAGVYVVDGEKITPPPVRF